jgi:hypothetical protein
MKGSLRHQSKQAKESMGDIDRQSQRLVQIGDLQAHSAAVSLRPLQDDMRTRLQDFIKKVGVVSGIELRHQQYQTLFGNPILLLAVLRPMGNRKMILQDSLVEIDNLLENDNAGLQGEYFTYCLLKKILGDSFQPRHWTSELRNFAGHPSFATWEAAPDETDASDFTYFDEHQTLMRWLLGESGAELADVWTRCPLKFHIEVKATPGSCDGVFHLSRLQKIKSKRLTVPSDRSTPEDIFVLFRVYCLSTDPHSQPGVQIYVDPCKFFEEGILQCEGEGWLVGPA